MALNTKVIEVNIEELILHGFSSHERYQIAAELQMELTRLLTEKGLPGALKNAGSIEQLNAGSFQLAHTNRKGYAGSQIAGAVYDALPAADSSPTE